MHLSVEIAASSRFKGEQIRVLMQRPNHDAGQQDCGCHGANSCSKIPQPLSFHHLEHLVHGWNDADSRQSRYLDGIVSFGGKALGVAKNVRG